jgi:2-methylisocitrate lyase-like PEP mutase family enzyme
VAFCDILADEDNPLAGHASMSDQSLSKSANLQALIHRRDKVLAVMHPPTAAHARVMEKAGYEALFVGTGGVVGAYTGLSDVGTATMTECVTIAGWIADSVSIPVIMDGDTGHGLYRDNGVRFYARSSLMISCFATLWPFLASWLTP